jgi:hypothetical protein
VSQVVVSSVEDWLVKAGAAVLGWVRRFRYGWVRKDTARQGLVGRGGSGMLGSGKLGHGMARRSGSGVTRSG